MLTCSPGMSFVKSFFLLVCFFHFLNFQEKKGFVKSDRPASPVCEFFLSHKIPFFFKGWLP